MCLFFLVFLSRPTILCALLGGITWRASVRMLSSDFFPLIKTSELFWGVVLVFCFPYLGYFLAD
jgi:hypothetical protein